MDAPRALNRVYVASTSIVHYHVCVCVHRTFPLQLPKNDDPAPLPPSLLPTWKRQLHRGRGLDGVRTKRSNALKYNA